MTSKKKRNKEINLWTSYENVIMQEKIFVWFAYAGVGGSGLMNE